jgi:hypothetical protein
MHVNTLNEDFGRRHEARTTINNSQVYLHDLLEIGQTCRAITDHNLKVSLILMKFTQCGRREHCGHLRWVGITIACHRKGWISPVQLN